MIERPKAQKIDEAESLPNYPLLYGVPEGAEAFVLMQRIQENKNPIIYVALDQTKLESVKESLRFFYPAVNVLTFPSWDCLPYDRVSPSNEVVGERIQTLMTLCQLQEKTSVGKHALILLTTLNAITQKMPAPALFNQGYWQGKPGSFINPEKLTSFLVKNGFQRVETVREIGEFAVRGGIIDLFPSGSQEPIRLDLFGNEIETIKTFDPLSQRTTGLRQKITIRPAAEILLNNETVVRFKQGYKEHFGARLDDDPLYEAIKEGRRHSGMEHWLPLFEDKMVSLFDYLPAPVNLFLDYQFSIALKAREEQVRDFYLARREQAEIEKAARKKVSYNPLPTHLLYIDQIEWQYKINSILNQKTCFEFSPFGAPPVQGIKDFKGQKLNIGGKRNDNKDIFYKHLKSLIYSSIEENKHVLIACYSQGSRDRLQAILEQQGIGVMIKIDHDSRQNKEQKWSRSQIGLGILRLEEGFVFDRIVVLTEKDILGDRLVRSSRRKKEADNFIQELSSLKEGDIVVHIEHGIGRYLSLETIQVAGASHDCIKIEYDGGDRLFVPVENIETLSRYGTGDSHTKLDKLGSTAWEEKKYRIKKNLFAIAGELLEIAAARALKKADVLEIDEGLYQEFSARFPYQETEDQIKSIEASIDDLRAGKPMDRLVCGDVGFGKTEIALRAAFVAAMAGTQVAVIVPTTLLCRQHYQEFKKRFAGFPLRIEALSRLVKAKQATQTKKDIATGQVDIVIGTHALLADSISFQQLGLMIVDEEQKFGVKQKERLKRLKENVHVLTLTATPIPRTLQLSLTGVRDLSLITSPPVDRMAVRTFVMPVDKIVIREALMREHYRGGQSFYVCPRISDLAKVTEILNEIVPELKTITAHGQMPAELLEDKMTAFYDGQYDVLLATNIIESGLDIPSANTMIIHRADLFGLSQLYQIRGRIGRSKARGYAYLTHDPHMALNKQAQERLRVLEQLDTLGAGFQIASHDMDIRGAGNLVGEEQTGHIREIGVELYQQMLQEAIEGAKQGKTDEADEPLKHWTPQINLGTAVMIPQTYIPDLNMRLSMYRRAAAMSEEEERDAFAAEMIDRFGPIPQEVENLLDIIVIKQLCRKAHVAKIEAGSKGAIVSFHQNYFEAVDNLLVYLQKQAGTIRLRPDQKLIVIRAWPKASDRVSGVRNLLQDLSDLLV